MKLILSKLERQGSGVFWTLFGLTLIMVAAMQYTGGPLKNELAPGGIVSFELVGELEGSLGMIRSWTPDTLVWVWANMLLDFLFLLSYALTIALGLILLGRQLQQAYPPVSGLTRLGANGILVAAVLDIIENFSLMLLLAGWEHPVLPMIARWMALPKFSLVLLALLLLMVLLLLLGVRRVLPRTKITQT